MESLGLSLEVADILANSLLESMNLIKIDIESLNKKYKNTEKEYLKIFEFTTEAKEIELGKKDKHRLAWEIDKALFLERQQNKQLKSSVAAAASKNISKYEDMDTVSIDL